MTRRCLSCNLIIMDSTEECPLCHRILEISQDAGEDSKSEGSMTADDDISTGDTVGNETGHADMAAGDTGDATGHADMAAGDASTGIRRRLRRPDDLDDGATGRSETYPDIYQKTHKLLLAIRIAVFAAIVAEGIVMVINYVTFNGVYWSLIVGAGLLYGIISLLYSVRTRRSLQSIVQTEMFLTIPLLLALDIILGYTGWSDGYAIPILFGAVDIAMVILMIIAVDGWQSYIMTEIVAFLLSILMLVLGLTGIANLTLFTLLSAAVTGLILAGTLIIGERMISNELRRRFRI